MSREYHNWHPMQQQVDEYSILKTKKPGQHDDKPFQEVLCKTNKDNSRRWREDVAREKIVFLKPSRDETCQNNYVTAFFEENK